MPLCSFEFRSALQRHNGTEGIWHAFEIVRAASWGVRLSTSAWRLVAGVLLVGKATGCRLAPAYTDSTDECLLCRQSGMRDTVEHVLGSCDCAAPLRDWVRQALQRVCGWAAPQGQGELLHLTYGRKDNTPADDAIRGAALDAVSYKHLTLPCRG